MREYTNNLTGATIVVADNVTITGENWEEKLPESSTEEENQQAADAKKKDKK